MEFPSDIWRVIFEYFSSPYKEPNHYRAIMEVPSFYFTRQSHRRHSVRRRLNFDTETTKSESYYERLTTTLSPFPNGLAPMSLKTLSDRGYLRRGVAQHGVVRDDFNDIFTQFRERNGTNQASRIHYGVAWWTLFDAARH